MGKKRKMTKGKPFLHIIFSAVSLLFSGYVAADTGVDDHVHRGDSLHKAYDFAGAEQAYLHALDSLDVVEDSLLVQDIREKLRMTENGKNMSRFVQSPQPAGKMRFSLDEFLFNNLFSGIIEEESPSDSWKTLLLMIVRNLRSNLDA